MAAKQKLQRSLCLCFCKCLCVKGERGRGDIVCVICAHAVYTGVAEHCSSLASVMMNMTKMMMTTMMKFTVNKFSSPHLFPRYRLTSSDQRKGNKLTTAYLRWL